MMEHGSASCDVASAGAVSLLAKAIETDRTYFELGAQLEPLPGAVLAWMPGLSSFPGGAVIQRVRPQFIAEQGSEWLGKAERALTEVGARMARIYLEEENGAASELLRRGGYSARQELIFADSLADPSSGLVLKPVESEADWTQKLQLHLAIATPPDGHDSSASKWVELERRKRDAGMDAFLAELDGQIVGALGAIWSDCLLRLKNIVVHPDHRRRSIGRAMVGRLASIGRTRGISEQCVFAVMGDAGEHFYRAAGMRMIGSVVEWSKPLESPKH